MALELDGKGPCFGSLLAIMISGPNEHTPHALWILQRALCVSGPVWGSSGPNPAQNPTEVNPNTPPRKQEILSKFTKQRKRSELYCSMYLGPMRKVWPFFTCLVLPCPHDVGSLSHRYHTVPERYVNDTLSIRFRGVLHTFVNVSLS